MRLFLLSFFSFIFLHAEVFFTPEMMQSHLRAYDSSEKALIEKDLEIVRSVCFDGKSKAGKPFYLATAGAPGACKTTTLEKFLDQHPKYNKAVYLDPDPRALRFMVHTYYAQSLSPLAVTKKMNYIDVIKDAYIKWRSASNYITITLFEEAVAKGLSVAHGTTSTGVHIPQFYQNLKQHGYEIVLLLCSCPDQMRQEAVMHRNEVVGFYQSSAEDVVDKGKLFPQKMGHYFKHADKIYLYWTGSLFAPERLAAIWHQGKLKVIDSGALRAFISKYESDRACLDLEGIHLPPFKAYLKQAKG